MAYANYALMTMTFTSKVDEDAHLHNDASYAAQTKY